MSDPYFFGYGSLVNRATHAHDDAHPASVRGWRRAWRRAATRPVSFLTVIPVAGAEIDGLIAGVPKADWRALDVREGSYDRILATDVGHPLPHAPKVHIYTIPEGRHSPPTSANPVLLSYLDTVVQGFLNEFGEDGVARFFATTDGWEAPIADDRHDPVYSRHQPLTRRERALVDRHLDDLAAVVEKLE